MQIFIAAKPITIEIDEIVNEKYQLIGELIPLSTIKQNIQQLGKLLFWSFLGPTDQSTAHILDARILLSRGNCYLTGRSIINWLKPSKKCEIFLYQ